MVLLERFGQEARRFVQLGTLSWWRTTKVELVKSYENFFTTPQTVSNLFQCFVPKMAPIGFSFKRLCFNHLMTRPGINSCQNRVAPSEGTLIRSYLPAELPWPWQVMKTYLTSFRLIRIYSLGFYWAWKMGIQRTNDIFQIETSSEETETGKNIFRF